jgi:hypothetical protein
MKINFKNSIASICLGILIITGCSKEDNPITNLLTAKMTATVKGESWSATTQTAAKTASTITIAGTQISTSLTSSIISITINGITADSYNVGVTGKICTATYTPNASSPSKSYLSSSGTVKISEINTSKKTISGTFSFTCIDGILTSDSVVIKNGSFSGIGYTEPTGR